MALGTRWQTIADENDTLKATVAAQHTEIAAISGRCAQAETELLAKTTLADQLASKVAGVEEQISDLKHLAHNLSDATESLKEQLFDAKNRVCELEDTLEFRDERISDLENKLQYQRGVNAKLAAAVAAKDAAIEYQEAKLSGKQVELDRILKDLDLFKKVATQRDQQISGYVKKQTFLSQQLANLRASLDLERAATRKRDHPPLQAKDENNHTSHFSPHLGAVAVAEKSKQVLQLEIENRQLKRTLEKERLRKHREVADVHAVVNPWSDEEG